jgi:hypothetical protein
VYVAPDITWTTVGCSGGGPNILPVANAGVDQTVDAATGTTTLLGGATDSDGTISTYAWTKVSGPSYTISNAAIAQPTLSALTAGTYVFRLTVTDNSGGQDTDDITITVVSYNSNGRPNRFRGPLRIKTTP